MECCKKVMECGKKEVKCGCMDSQIYDVIGLCDLKKIQVVKPSGATDPGDLTWVQISIPEVLRIPKQKPDIEEIDKVFIKVKIISKRVLSTPDSGTATNTEGTKVTGRKLAVEGILQQKIVYTADEPQQSVHSAHFDIPFSTFIVLNSTASLDDQYCIETCVEDVYAKILDSRNIFKNVTLFLRAKRALPPTC